MPESLDPYYIAMPEYVFKHINHITVRDHGVDLMALAQQSPEIAYSALRTGLLEAILDRHPVTVDASTGMVVDADQDSKAAQVGFTENILSEKVVPTMFEPRDVIISIVRKRTLLDIIKNKRPEPKVMLSFTINQE